VTPRVEALLARLDSAESELRQDLVNQAERWGFTVGRRTARFREDLRQAHRALKPSVWTFLKAARPLPILTAPLIYSVSLPLVLLDAWMTLYQWVCFPVYGISRVRRRDYLVIDHQHLGYLNAIEKMHCMYCGYANGLLAYVREIAARTEQYWCPIKHAAPIPAPHSRYHLFADYGDAEGYRRDLDGFRRALSTEHQNPGRSRAARGMARTR
jgi:hypothetical protein